MFLQKIIGAFLVIPGLFILLLIAGSFFFKKTRWFLLVLAAIVYLFSSYVGEFLFLRPLEKNLDVPATLPDDAVIVVLGGGTERNTKAGDTLSDATLRRLLAGVHIYQETKLPVLVTGGSLTGLRPEAMIMKDYLVSLGIPEEKITVEDRSRNTYENALFTREKIGDVPIILVTDSIHMRRAVFTFKRFFQSVTPYPAGFYFGDPEFIDFLPNATSFYLNSRAIYEWIGLVWYNFKWR